MKTIAQQFFYLMNILKYTSFHLRYDYELIQISAIDVPNPI